eukprot:514189-Ditylum_brightwellii.AAC.1
MSPRLTFDAWHGSSEGYMVRFRMIDEVPGARVSLKPGKYACSMLGTHGCTLSPEACPIEGITAFACRTDANEVGKRQLKADWEGPLGENLSSMIALCHRMISKTAGADDIARAVSLN